MKLEIDKLNYFPKKIRENPSTVFPAVSSERSENNSGVNEKYEDLEMEPTKESKKLIKEEPCKIGNSFVFWYKNGDPIFTIGPHCKFLLTIRAFLCRFNYYNIGYLLFLHTYLMEKPKHFREVYWLWAIAFSILKLYLRLYY